MDRFYNKKVFVTGGSGFIGGRLIDSLILDHGAKVKALVNSSASAIRMARHSLELIEGPITNHELMKTAVQGCDYVFHLAYGSTGSTEEQRHVTVEGTRSICKAAAANSVRRLVNTSTAAVYGKTPNVEVSEEFPTNHAGWHYAKQKLEAEKIISQFGNELGLPWCNFRLVGVYGPWGPVFTLMPIAQLKSGRVVLVNDGNGLVNATYVDDVVQGLLLGAIKEEANGQSFNLKGPGTVTRKDFYDAYREMLNLDGESSFIGMTKQEILKALDKDSWDALRSIPSSALNALKSSEQFRRYFSTSILKNMYGIVRKFTPRSSANNNSTVEEITKKIFTKPYIYPHKSMIDRLAAKTVFSAEKANRLLGYSPKYSLQDGMALTEKWAKWSKILE